MIYALILIVMTGNSGLQIRRVAEYRDVAMCNASALVFEKTKVDGFTNIRAYCIPAMERM